MTSYASGAESKRSPETSSSESGGSAGDGGGTQEPIHSRQPLTTRQYVQRIPFGNWGAKSTRSLILGDPGSGKTTLLRFLALDLLTGHPALSSLAKKWGSYLPIWIPFAMWTKLIVEHAAGDPGLEGLIDRWLTAWNSKDLIPLVKAALRDKRLLLLIDGLDEYANKSAAQIALNHLEHFLNENKTVGIVVTSRPHGFKELGRKLDGWAEAEIAPLSTSQQRELAAISFIEHSRKISPTLDDERRSAEVEKEGDNFCRELARSNELHQLATNPLLLSLLIYLQISNVRLPASRFSAYESLVNHLELHRTLGTRQTAGRMGCPK